MTATRTSILKLYKTMLRESEKFSSYNYRTYAVRRIRDAFKVNKNLQDHDLVQTEFNRASKTLAIIKRQVIISNLYKTDKLVIEVNT